MFFMATFHLAINGFRLVRGYADMSDAEGGPVAYYGDLRRWDHILKDTIFVTQENLGSAAAVNIDSSPVVTRKLTARQIYRTWTLWAHNWKVIIIPTVMLMVNIEIWIKTFYSMAVVLNIITTSLMAWRIYSIHKQSANYSLGQGKLLSILRILVESAALQLIAEIVLLALYCQDINAQYFLLECVAAVVAITFNTITLRIKVETYSEKHNSLPGMSGHPTQTIGSIPMKRIHVNIEQEVDNRDDRSFSPLDDRISEMEKA
ncbi:hypothetical protein JR316_0005556 [Psilocybe cubensis]|uniref:Uncharacterized protein n=1 Tax=Psilocybe cubensis TaxID=181762 RepID=A0ACB8H031_PSICU|nr:hypothetical protein JR316_0005556 [Psilocybe cubensis]KAH9481037.1 hypothetical protein JR316_0005556 [Psilocybe cubensis]